MRFKNESCGTVFKILEFEEKFFLLVKKFLEPLSLLVKCKNDKLSDFKFHLPSFKENIDEKNIKNN